MDKYLIECISTEDYKGRVIVQISKFNDDIEREVYANDIMIHWLKHYNQFRPHGILVVEDIGQEFIYRQYNRLEDDDMEGLMCSLELAEGLGDAKLAKQIQQEIEEIKKYRCEKYS